jgi:hypothetical protein
MLCGLLGLPHFFEAQYWLHEQQRQHLPGADVDYQVVHTTHMTRIEGSLLHLPVEAQ